MTDTIQCSKQETLGKQVNHGQEEDDDGELIDAMHHANVHVAWTGRVPLAEEIAANFAERQKLAPA